MAVPTGLATHAVNRQREADFANFVREKCWLYSCCCVGSGCAAPTPLAWAQSKVLCFRAKTTTGEDCSGPLGLCSSMSKCLCVMEHCEFPPSPCKLGCCNIFCCGGNPKVPRIMGADEAQNVAFFQNTFWCYYCCCEGCGCTGFGDPLVKGRGKFFCIQSESETADCFGDEGCIMSASKCCCCAAYMVLPPNITPGIGCCGITFCGQGTGVRDVSLQAPIQTEMTRSFDA